MKTKTPKLKPRRMWATIDGNIVTVISESRRLKKRSKHDTVPDYIPVAVVPLDDVDGLLRKAGDAFAASHDGSLHKDDIRAVFMAIGLIPRQRKKGGRK